MPRKKKKSIPSIIFLFIIVCALTLVFALFKSTASETQYIYVKVKVSQGFWWASTSKPSPWYAKAIKKGDIEYNILGKPTAEILEVRYYSVFSKNEPTENKYDIYLTIKLAADYNNRTQKYVFKRSNITISSPIELETQSTQITGTVIDVSEQEFADEYIEKTIFLTKNFAHPWEYEAIKVGDSYFDGEEIVFEVLGKNQVATSEIKTDYYGNLLPSTIDATSHIVIKAKVKVRIDNEELLFGEERILNSGARLTVNTSIFNYSDFVVGKIE